MGCGVVERHLEMAQPTKKKKPFLIHSEVPIENCTRGRMGNPQFLSPFVDWFKIVLKVSRNF